MTARSMPALGFDPTPGSSWETRQLAKGMGDITAELGRIVTDVSRADQGAWRGQAATAFMDHLNDDLKPAVAKCHDSFSQASVSLYKWAGQLDGFQSEADGLEREASTQQGVVDAAKKAAYGGNGQPVPTPAAQGSDQAAQDVKHQKALTDANTAMNNIVQRAHDLHDRYISAAKVIADELHHAGQMAPGKPGLFDSICHDIASGFSGAWHWVEKHAEAIKFIGDLLSDLAGVLGILAIICAPFEPLGAIFAVAAVAASAAALLTHLLAKAAGANVSWLSIGADALGAIPGIGAFAKGAKVADGALAVARAGELGAGFRGVSTIGRSIVSFGHDASALKSFSAFGKTISVWGFKAGGFISHDGSFLGRAQMIVEQNYKPGQWIGSRALNLIPKVNLNTMSTATRAFDVVAAKVVPKAFTLGVLGGWKEYTGDPFHQAAGAH